MPPTCLSVTHIGPISNYYEQLLYLLGYCGIMSHVKKIKLVIINNCSKRKKIYSQHSSSFLNKFEDLVRRI